MGVSGTSKKAIVDSEEKSEEIKINFESNKCFKSLSTKNTYFKNFNRIC